MWAAAERHPEVVKVLVEHRADLQSRTKKGFTALHFAARAGDVESARVLLDAGVDVNMRSQPDTPAVRTAARRGSRLSRRWRAWRQGQRSQLRGDRVGRQYVAACGNGQGTGSARTVPPRAGRRSERGRCRLHATALGCGDVGERGSESRVRLQRCDERDSGATGEAPACEVAAGARRESMPHDPAAAWIRREATTTRRRDAVLARRCDSRYRDDAAPAGGRRRSVADHQEQHDGVDGRGGMNRTLGESAVTEDQAFEAASFCSSLERTPRRSPRTAKTRCSGHAYRGWNTAASTDDRQRSGCECRQQGGHHAVAGGFGTWAIASAACCSTPTRRRSS